MAMLIAMFSFSATQTTNTTCEDRYRRWQALHPPRMHEFNAGVRLLYECLKGSALRAEFSLNGWPQDEAGFKTLQPLSSS